MNISDVIIIYLTGGAPFAVYYYLQNRQRLFLRQLVFKTVLNLIFWLPSALYFLFGRLTRRRVRPRNEIACREIEEAAGELQSQLEKIFGEHNSGAEFYQFKEVSARYTGLSLAVLSERDEPANSVKSLLQFSESDNSELGAICLKRRNRQKLSHHQKLAGEDFVSAIIEFSAKIDYKIPVEQLSLELSEILNDERANTRIRQYFRRDGEKIRKSNGEFAEKLLWKNPPSKLTNPEPISISLTNFKRSAQNFKD